MLQFTQARKPRGLFGLPDYMTPGGGIGGGLDGAVREAAPGNPGSSAEPRKKGGIFGSPVVKGIAGTLGDFLLQQSGMDPVFAPQMRLRQRMEAEEQQYQRRRGAEFADWQQRYDYERDNPKREATPYRTEDNAGNVWEMGPDGQFKPVFVDPNDKVYMQDGQMITVPNTVRQGAAPAIAPGAIVPDPRKQGGAASPGRRPFSAAPPVRLNSGFMTSGRRTPEGNAAVGGVANSKHLTGEAADYWGKDLEAVLREARGLPGLRKAFIHGQGPKRHVHTEGDWNTPYVGRRGTRGRKR